jgi:glycosyltransferase involved in cell wall biosynthesis
MPIPTNGWGAVEIIIDELSKRIPTIKVFNTKNLYSILNQLLEYDIIHIQYDDHFPFFVEWRDHCIKNGIKVPPIVGTTHYGYIKEKYLWGYGYSHLFKNTLALDGIIALSPEIKTIYEKNGKKSFVLRNGTDCSRVKRDYPNRSALCLGKITTRKKQYELSKLLGIDFVGPIEDSRFNSPNYLGTWTRDDVYNNLCNYACLILVSDGEAAPLVVPEALSAGLSLIVSKTAAANLTAAPFITVIDKHTEINQAMIDKAVQNNCRYRHTIIDYSKHFDWGRIAIEYLEIIKTIINNQ